MKLSALFDDKDFYKGLFTIAVPIMLQNLINSLVNMADTVMIGRLGTAEIAAVGLGNQVFFLYNMILFGICSGGSVFTAQFWGKKDIPGIRKNTGLCLALTAGIGLVFTLGTALFPAELIGFYSKDPAVVSAGAAYLRALSPSLIPYAISCVFVLTLRSVERVKLAMVSTIISLSINVVLNYCFIFGIGPIPAMGVRGAAMATVIARLAEMGILITVSYARRYCLAGTVRELTAFNSAFVRRFLIIAFPVIVNELLWALGINMQNLVFARTDTNAIAAFNITTTVSQLTWVIFMGLGNGAAVLIGKKIGESDEKLAREYANRITAFAPLVAVAAALVLFPLSRIIPLIFNVHETVLVNTRSMFIILCAAYPFRAFNMSMIVGVCRAGGDTVFCAVYDILFMWTIALPLASLAAFFFQAPVWLIYLCVSIEDPLKAILGFLRLKSGKWLRHVT